MNNEEIGMLKEAILDSMESYIDTIMDSLPFAKIEIGRILGMGSEKGNKVVINRVIYKGEIIKEGITYDNVLAVGNFRYSVGDMVYLCVPNGQYGNMFIMGTMGKNRTNDKALQDLTDVEISSAIEDNSLLTYDEIKHQWTSRKLPIASADKLGVVKVGDNVSIDENGALSAEIPIASSTTLGGVKIGENLEITEDGVLSSVGGISEIPIATTETLGGIKVGDNLSITEDGVLSASGGSTVEWNQIQTSGSKIAEVTIDGTKKDVYAPTGGGGNNVYSTDETIIGTWQKADGTVVDLYRRIVYTSLHSMGQDDAVDIYIPPEDVTEIVRIDGLYKDTGGYAHPHNIAYLKLNQYSFLGIRPSNTIYQVSNMNNISSNTLIIEYIKA